MNNIQKKIMKNGWLTNIENDCSICGGGSLLKSNTEVIQLINEVIEKYNINSINDIGCGDLNYIKYTNISKLNIDYLGYDLIPRLNFSTEQLPIYKEEFDIINNVPRPVDLTICKDILNHLDIKTQVNNCLDNIKKSTKYLLLTNYDNIMENNYENNYNGTWTKINFNIKPFNFQNMFIKRINVKHINFYKNPDIYFNLYKLN